MHVSSILPALFSYCPAPIGCLLLRAYCRSLGAAPTRQHWLLQDLQYQLTPAGSVRTVCIGRGMRLRIDAGSVQGNPIYYYGSCDAALASFLHDFLRPGMIYIDAGANLGEFVVRAARRVGRHGKVYALEAAPDTFKNLEYNIALNRLTQVRAIHAAVADSDGPVQFFPYPGRDSGSSSLYPPSDGSVQAVTVPGMTLDTLAECEHLEAVDLIKLDVEGAELAALRGMPKLLGSPRPPVVVFEYHPEANARQGLAWGELQGLLRSFGYRMRLLDDGGLGPEIAAEPATGHPTVVAMR